MEFQVARHLMIVMGGKFTSNIQTSSVKYALRKWKCSDRWPNENFTKRLNHLKS